jgi:fatty acid desaturase
MREPYERLSHPSLAWREFLQTPSAALLTHGSIALLIVAFYVLLLTGRFWLVCLPCALVQHRIGVLLHEYIHGIPCRRYRTNLRIISVVDGLMLMFGLTELFRGTHLAHHRWLNTERDPAFTAERDNRSTRWGRVAALEGVQHLIYLVQSLGGRHPYVQPSRLIQGAAVSSVVWLGWVAIGQPWVPVMVVGLTLYNTLIPVSFRGAVEHHSHPGDPAFANEYRVLIPLFNLNKHIHHHENPRLPWYRLEYRTARPLWTFHYFTHWFKVYVTRSFVLMKPFSRKQAGGLKSSQLPEAGRRS